MMSALRSRLSLKLKHLRPQRRPAQNRTVSPKKLPAQQAITSLPQLNASRCDAYPAKSLAQELVLAQRALVLHGQAVVPVAGEVALEAGVDGGGDQHRQQGTKACQGHILVGVPDIALGPEISGAEI